MHRVAVWACLWSLAGCWTGSSSPSPATPATNPAPAQQAYTAPRHEPPVDPDDPMPKMEAFRDEMCACHDVACVQQVSDEMVKWSQELAKTNKQPKLSDDQTKRATEIGQTMAACMTTAMGVGSGQTP